MNIEQMIDELLPTVRKILLTGEQLSPVFMTEDPASHVKIGIAPWQDRESRGHILNALRVQMQEDRVVRYVSVSEAWMAAYTQDSIASDGSVMGPMPSQRMDRKEVVVVSAVDTHPSKRIVMRVYDIDRDNKEDPLVLNEKMSKEGGDVTGDLLTLLDAPTRPIDASVKVVDLSDKQTVH